VEYLEKIHSRIETGAYTGSVLTVNMDRVTKLKGGTEPQKGETPQQTFERERDRVDVLIRETSKAYCNSIIGQAEMQLLKANQETEMAKVKAKGTELRTQGMQLADGNELSVQMARYNKLESDLKVTEELLKRATLVATAYKKTMNDYVTPLSEYRDRIHKAVVNSEFNQSLKDLQTVNEVGGEAKTKLQEALDQQVIQDFLKEQEAAKRQTEEEVNRLLAEQSQSSQSTPATATSKGSA
jgi:hypothetical protein